jgi:hypothetical protein
MAKDLYTAVPAGQILFREGDKGSEMYILESGSVEIVRGGAVLATLEAGDFFGEMAILEDQPRFATAQAKSDARVLKIERATFADLLRANVEIAVRIMRKLVARQRRAEQRLAEANAELAKLKSAGAPVAAVSATPGPTAPPPAEAASAAKPPRKPRESAEAKAATVPVPTPPPAPIAATPAAAPAATAVAPAESAARGPLMLLHAASGQRIDLPADKAEFLVGRPDPVTGITPDINLGPLDSGRSLSRRHAKVLREGLLLFVREEVGTANGTFVNGQRLATGATTPLKPGDKLRFGAVELDVVSA